MRLLVLPRWLVGKMRFATSLVKFLALESASLVAIEGHILDLNTHEQFLLPAPPALQFLALLAFDDILKKLD